MCLFSFGLQGARAAASSGSASYQHGVTAVAAKHYVEAARDFEQAIVHGHNDPDTYYQLGLAYSHLKRWNDAVWAISTALTDSAFYAARQKQAMASLSTASAAGGVEVGPPPILRKATMSAGYLPTLSAAQFAVRESQSAFQALQNGTFFVSPEFNKQVTSTTVGALTLAAADLQNNSNTVAKFVYLGATPVPFTSLSAYSKVLFTRLGLQHAVLVAITPNAVAAYSDRLDSDTARYIANTQLRTGPHNPADLAAAIARAVVRRADDNDNSSARTSLLIGIGVTALIVILVAVTILRVAGRRSANAPRIRRVPSHTRVR